MPKGLSEVIYRRRAGNAMAKRKKTNDKQWSTSGVARKKEHVSRGSAGQQPPKDGDVFLQRMAKIHVW